MEVKCAKKVFLAIPKLALERLDWEVLKREEIADIIKVCFCRVLTKPSYLGRWRAGLENGRLLVRSQTGPISSQD